MSDRQGGYERNCKIMSYYRAALAAANKGDMETALRLAQCSIALKEDAPSAVRLLTLLQDSAGAGAGLGEGACVGALTILRGLIEGGKYKKALKVKLPPTSKSHTIHGLLYALLGRRRAALDSFTQALVMDTGNIVAKDTLIYLRKGKRK